MKTKAILTFLIVTLFYAVSASSSPNLACDTGGHSCALHDQQNAHVGDHCQCNQNGHSTQGTVATVVCSTQGGHSCSTNQNVGSHCGCTENGHQVQGTVIIQRGHGSNQNNQSNQHGNQNYRNNQH